jgi:tRNA pseudouridine55 synthase
VQLGLTTSTDDLEGEVIRRAALPEGLTRADLERALGGFRGTIEQVPPQVSAVHVNGQRAYQRVRRGEQPALEARPVTIHNVDLLDWDPLSGQLELALRCSAGTYVRALARDLGTVLGCGGALARLRRTEALGFGLEQALPLEALDAGSPPPLLDPLLPLAHLPRRQLSPAELSGWRCGRALSSDLPMAAGAAVVVLQPDGNLAGMARSDGVGHLQPRLVLHAAA